MEPKLLLLGLLRQQEMHGYQLVEYIEQALSTCTDLKKPGAYYLLNRMAQDGWIEERQEQEGNRPPRKVYHLTAEGEMVFQRLLHASAAGYTVPDSPQDAGLAFLDALPPHAVRALLELRVAAMTAALSSAQSAPAHPGSLGWLIERQIHLLRADLAWHEALLSRITPKQE